MAAKQLRNDIRALRDQLQLRAPNAILVADILVPDFELSGDEDASGVAFVGQ